MIRLYVPLPGNGGNDTIRNTVLYYCKNKGIQMVNPYRIHKDVTLKNRLQTLLYCQAMLLLPKSMHDEYTDIEHRVAVLTGIQMVRLDALAVAESIIEQLTGIAMLLSGVNPNDITVKKRDRKLVDMRRMIAAILREHYGVSLTKIGQYLNRDHSDVVYLLHTHKNLLTTDDGYRKIYQIFTQSINQGSGYEQ